MDSPPQVQSVGKALSVFRELRFPDRGPASVPGNYKYYPAEYELIRQVPSMECVWRISKIYRDYFYFSTDPATRAAISLAHEAKLAFIAGLKDRKKASKDDLIFFFGKDEE